MSETKQIKQLEKILYTFTCKNCLFKNELDYNMFIKNTYKCKICNKIVRKEFNKSSNRMEYHSFTSYVISTFRSFLLNKNYKYIDENKQIEEVKIFMSISIYYFRHLENLINIQKDSILSFFV